MSHKLLLVVSLSIGIVSVAMAAGSESASESPAAIKSKYDQAVDAVNDGNYRIAVRLLNDVVQSQPNNADAWNYVGFSHRKMKAFDEALVAYKKALAIDPKHRGANEYLGELYLEMGEPKKAKERLEVLNEACPAGCEEYDELRAAIEKRESG